MRLIYKIGFLVFMQKEAILSALFKPTTNIKTTFTDQSRNKFGVNDEILI